MPAATGSSTSAPEDHSCQLFRVTGRVQGVFFRASTQTTARDLGLGGYAKNLPDGSVEVLACGSRDALAQLGSWLHEGPPMAAVTNVDSELRPFEEIEAFTIG